MRMRLDYLARLKCEWNNKKKPTEVEYIQGFLLQIGIFAVISELC